MIGCGGNFANNRWGIWICAIEHSCHLNIFSILSFPSFLSCLPSRQERENSSLFMNKAKSSYLTISKIYWQTQLLQDSIVTFWNKSSIHTFFLQDHFIYIAFNLKGKRLIIYLWYSFSCIFTLYVRNIMGQRQFLRSVHDLHQLKISMASSSLKSYITTTVP